MLASIICLTDKWFHDKNGVQEIENEKFKTDNDYFNLFFLFLSFYSRIKYSADKLIGFIKKIMII